VQHILTLKTAGQPPRQVQVVKTVRTVDGVHMTDVKDLNTGEILSLTDSQMKAMTSSTKATVKPRSNDPLLTALTSRTPEPVFSAKPKETLATPATVKPVIAVNAEVPSQVGATRVQSVPLEPLPMPPAMMPVHTTTRVDGPYEIMMQETATFRKNLADAVRPTVRMDAATTLCEGRYASRPEMKAVIAKVAESDPAAIVRAHCISCLSALGHADAEYVQVLETLRGRDQSVEVRRAAAEALKKLQPR
jgi:hypothetical protein